MCAGKNNMYDLVGFVVSNHVHCSYHRHSEFIYIYCMFAWIIIWWLSVPVTGRRVINNITGGWKDVCIRQCSVFTHRSTSPCQADNKKNFFQWLKKIFRKYDVSYSTNEYFRIFLLFGWSTNIWFVLCPDSNISLGLVVLSGVHRPILWFTQQYRWPAINNIIMSSMSICPPKTKSSAVESYFDLVLFWEWKNTFLFECLYDYCMIVEFRWSMSRLFTQYSMNRRSHWSLNMCKYSNCDNGHMCPVHHTR